jgi:hypothetical protein
MTTVIGDPIRSGRTALAVTLSLLALAAALVSLGCTSRARVAGGPANRSRGASRRGLCGGSGRDGLTGGPDLGRVSPAGPRGTAFKGRRWWRPGEARDGTIRGHCAESARGDVAGCQGSEESSHSRAQRAASSEEKPRAGPEQAGRDTHAGSEVTREAAPGDDGDRSLHQTRPQESGRRSAGPVPSVSPGEGWNQPRGAPPIVRPAHHEGPFAAAGSDAALARDIVTSREGIWSLLADPAKFAALS